MPYLVARVTSHSQYSQEVVQPPSQDQHPRSVSSSTYDIDDITLLNESCIQTTTHPVENTTPSSNTPQYIVPIPDLAFLSKYQQVTLPAVISDLASGKVDTPTLALPVSFEPTNFDVLCGRGKGSYNRPGNRRFRAIVQQHTDEYQASSKVDKTMVLNRIMNLVQAQNEGTTRFVKRGKDGLFTVISDDLAREKVGHAIRETIMAAENAAKPLIEQPEWREKHSDLLAQQQSIFQNLVG
jgi:hypothetical protein